jgi:hypothetical protein
VAELENEEKFQEKKSRLMEDCLKTAEELREQLLSNPNLQKFNYVLKEQLVEVYANS